MIAHHRLRLLTGAALAGAGFFVSAEAAYAQATPTTHTSGIRYDALGRVTGTIAPDPDDTGPLPRPAVRNTYDASGNLTKVETGYLSTWHAETVSPENWTGFTITNSVDYTYDAVGRKLTQVARGSDGIAVSLTQFSYTAAGDVECTAIRMNPAAYGSLPASACSLGPTGAFGEDRITRNVYQSAGVVQKVQQAVGTALQQDYATYTYSPNLKVTSLTDARGMKAGMAYDGFDRLVRWHLPDKIYSGTISTSDYEEYGYDNNGNRTSLRKRDGATFQFNYDQLNRIVSKIVPERVGLSSTHTRDVFYGYDLRGLQTYARFDGPGGEGITMAYDGFGRPVTETKVLDGAWALGSGYDAASNRTTFVFSDREPVSTFYDNLNRATSMWRSGGHLANFNYVVTGRLESEARAGSYSFYGYDASGRLNFLAQGFAVNGPANNLHVWMGRNPAGQITTRTANNDGYAWTAHVNVQRDYAVNGINQYTSAGAASFSYDANGNLTSDGSTTFTYDAENRLVGASGAKNATLRYDPLGRLHEVSGGSGVTRFIWDGNALAMEYDAAGNILRRYTHGPNRAADDPIVWDEGSGVTCASARFLMRDQQNSVVTAADCSGNRLLVNRYDEYGIPQGSNVGRFQYTGQAWIAELGMYHYKARFYSPTLGRFMQTDPIGYEDGVNLYAYVGNDPVNKVDPTGNSCEITPVNKDGVIARVVCRIDNAKSFRENGFSDSDINALARSYAKAVVRALEAGDQKINLSVAGRSFQTTGNEVARGLSNSYVEFNGHGDRARLLGGPLSGQSYRDIADRANIGGLPFKLQIGRNMFANEGAQYGSLARQMQDTFIHEGFHTARGEKVMVGLPNFNEAHQDEYKSKARKM